MAIRRRIWELTLLALLFQQVPAANHKLQEAKELLSKGAERQAEALLQEILLDDPRDPEANYWRGYLAAKSMDYPRAVLHLNAAIAGPTKADALKLVAKVHILAGQSLDAEMRLMELTRLSPRDPEAWSLLGQLYEKQNRFKEALPLLEKSVRLAPGDAPTLAALAFTYFAEGNLKEAEKTFKKAVRQNSRQARPAAATHASFAIFLIRTQKLSEAQAQLDRALQIDARDPLALQARQALEARLRSRDSGKQQAEPMAAQLPQFEDLALAAGIKFRLENEPTPFKHQIETMPGGVAVLDYDNDGLMDIYFTNGAGSPTLEKAGPEHWNRLYRNLGDWQFEDVTEKAGVQGVGYMIGAAAGDFDNDGHVDLFVVGVDRNILYRNNGDGTFSDITQAAGFGRPDPHYGVMWGIHAAWLDFDNDGWLDLLLVNYCQWDPKTEPFCGDRRPNHRAYCYPGKYGPLPNQLFRNNQDGTFSDISQSSGINRHLGKGMGAAIADFNGDGLIDFFIANDTEPDFLFLNLGNGRFQEVGLEKGVALNQFGAVMSSMGADFRDIDNDGRPDLFVTALSNEGFLLFRNNGRFFDDIRDPAGIALPSLPFGGWSNAIVDLNNSGWKDLFSANSHALDNIELFQNRTYHQRNSVFLNQGNGTFQDVSDDPALGLHRQAAHRGSAVADFDNDGRMDLVVTALGDHPSLLRNVTEGAGNWLLVRLVGRTANRDGLGAILSIETEEGKKLWNHATTSVGFASSSDPRVHFGLGDSRFVKSLTITWPGGRIQTLGNLEANQLITVVEADR
jgi:enediyne biosynthesis protein E4